MVGQCRSTRPSLEEHFDAYMKTKHATQHIEHTSKPDPVDPAPRQPPKTTHDATSTTLKPVDSVMEATSPPASTRSTDSEVQTQAGARASTDSMFKPPTPLKNYRIEPKLWTETGPEAGKAIAEWKEQFVPIIHDTTADMTIEERAEFFDKLIKEDEDRYLQPLGAYYTVYPDHIPDRDPDSKQKKRIEEGMNDLTPIMARKQKETFEKYLNGDWSWDPNRPVVELEPDLGPRDEPIPSEETQPCQHCISKTRKGKAMKIVKPLAAPVMVPVRAIQRQLSKTKGSMASHDTSDSQSTEASVETSDDEASSKNSKDSKPRDVTETGVGMRRPMSVPRRRRERKHDAVHRF